MHRFFFFTLFWHFMQSQNHFYDSTTLRPDLSGEQILGFLQVTCEIPPLPEAVAYDWVFAGRSWARGRSVGTFTRTPLPWA